MGRSEAGAACDLAQVLVHQVFDITVKMNIFNAAAADTDQVVVVAEQWFGQFKVGIITPRVDSPDGTAANQHVQVAIGRAPGHFGICIHDVGQRYGMSGLS